MLPTEVSSFTQSLVANSFPTSSIVIEASELVALLAQDSAVLNIASPTRIADDYTITIYTERFTGIHVTCLAFLVQNHESQVALRRTSGR
jgi:hypothetical protein